MDVGGGSVGAVGSRTDGDVAAVVGLVALGVFGVVLEEGARNGSSDVRGSTASLSKPLMNDSKYSEGEAGAARWKSDFSFAIRTAVRNRSSTHTLAPLSKRSGVE